MGGTLARLKKGSKVTFSKHESVMKMIREFFEKRCAGIVVFGNRAKGSDSGTIGPKGSDFGTIGQRVQTLEQ